VALDETVERLADDHDNARLLAQGLAAIDGVILDPQTVETNIVYFDLGPGKQSAAELAAGLSQRGVLINPTGARRLRAVTNYQISATDIETTLAAIEEVLGGKAAPAPDLAASFYR
jgi:threonine aldolase